MRFILALLISSFFLLPSAHAADTDYGVSADDMLTESVTILAVSSLTAPISEIALVYSRENNKDVNTVFESAGELVRQIDNGDPADIIIFSNDRRMKDVKDRGLVDSNSVTKIALNTLVVAAAKKVAVPQNLSLPEALDYIHSRMLMVMANPEDNSLGEATREMLVNQQRWDKFEKLVVLAPNSSKTTDLVIKSETAGVIYATDYFLREKELDKVAAIPPSTHSPIIYKGAAVVGKNMDEARKFLKFLNSKQAKNIFKKYGFIVG